MFCVINWSFFNVIGEYLTQSQIYLECSVLVVEEKTSINFLNESVSFIRFCNYFFSVGFIIVISLIFLHEPDNFEPHSSLKLCLTNISSFLSNFVGCESFFESNSPDILALCETKFFNSIESSNSPRLYLGLIWKESLLFKCMIL